MGVWFLGPSNVKSLKWFDVTSERGPNLFKSRLSLIITFYSTAYYIDEVEKRQRILKYFDLCSWTAIKRFPDKEFRGLWITRLLSLAHHYAMSQDIANLNQP